MSFVPRDLSLALFRIHIENGLGVAFGVGLAASLAGWAWGGEAAVAAATGALCVSICDQVDPRRQKPLILALGALAALFFTALASLTAFSPAAFLPATALAGFWGGFITAYGKRALSISMAGLLAFIFAGGLGLESAAALWRHLALFAEGAAFYAFYALLLAWALDDRVRRLLLGEAMRAFVAYLRAKALLYDQNGEGGFRALIDAHAELAERLQAARDGLFARRQTETQLRRIDALVALLDAFEAVLASDADVEMLRPSPHRHLLRRLDAVTNLIAGEVERLILDLRRPAAQPIARRHDDEFAAIRAEIDRIAAGATDEDETRTIAAFRATANKLSYADGHVARLAAALDPANGPSEIAAGIDLDAFRGPGGLRYLAGQWNLRAPALRYAIRLAAAMTAGRVITMLMTGIAHGNWVLLTIALVMRANYSITSQRRWDRVTGTLAGCALAALLIYLLPSPALLVILVLAVGVSHAYSLVRYRVTAISASVMALLLLHFTMPLAPFEFAERILDTMIGAGISYVFGFLLPGWERHDLPRTLAALLDADARFAEAALARNPERQPYRLARKRAVDAVAALAGAVRRLAAEPHVARETLALLNRLLAANYLLVSDLSSLPMLEHLRGGDLDPVKSDLMIATVRQRVLGSFADPSAAAPVETHMDRRGLSALKSYEAMSVLERRLAHIERSARRVARLAATLTPG